jgi:type IV pilus assembly protein PilN
MIKINLVPAEVLIAEQQKRRTVQAAAAGVLVALAVVMASLWHLNRVRKLEVALAANKAELAKLQKIVDQVKELEATAKAVQNRLNVITSLLTGRFLYTVFLDDWARSLPTGVWVGSLTTTQAGSGLTISAQGSARDESEIADWLRALQTSTKFSGFELGAVSLAGAAPDISYGFSLKGKYNFVPPKDTPGSVPGK